MIKEDILRLSEADQTIPTEEEVVAWLKKNPNPKDSQVHAWSEEKNINTHELESMFYKLATKYAQSQ